MHWFRIHQFPVVAPLHKQLQPYPKPRKPITREQSRERSKVIADGPANRIPRLAAPTTLLLLVFPHQPAPGSQLSYAGQSSGNFQGGEAEVRECTETPSSSLIRCPQRPLPSALNKNGALRRCSSSYGAKHNWEGKRPEVTAVWPILPPPSGLGACLRMRRPEGCG